MRHAVVDAASQTAPSKPAGKEQAKAAKLAEKEQVKAAKLAEKEQVKAAKLAEKEQVKAAKLAEKQQAKAAKLAEKEQAKAAKLAEKEQVNAAKLAEKDQVNAAKLAEKESDTAKLVAFEAKAYEQCSKNFHGCHKAWNNHAIVDGKNGWVEYELNNDTARMVMITSEYNAKDSRPLQLSLNGTVVESHYASGTSGSWKDTSKLISCEVGPVELPAGKSVLRLETKGHFPHLMRHAIIEAPAPEYTEATSDNSAEAEMRLLLSKLETMGFSNTGANKHAVAAANGNLDMAIEILLTSDLTMVSSE